MIFRTKFALKDYFQSKTEGVNITTEFCISELVYNISHELLRPIQSLEKNSENSGMIHFAETNQAPPPYSMLQYVGRVATPKFVPRNCLRYLQTTLIMGGGGLVSEFMWGAVGAKFQPKLKILIFWTKFAQKRCFRSKTKKVNITIEFCIFELV